MRRAPASPSRYGRNIRASRIAVLFVACLSTAGCMGSAPGDDVSDFWITLTYVQEAQQLETMVADLTPKLQGCDGGPQALAKLGQMASDLRATVSSGNYTGHNPAATIEQDVEAAYDVAVTCGVVDPMVTSEAQWRSTWWDVSSP